MIKKRNTSSIFFFKQKTAYEIMPSLVATAKARCSEAALVVSELAHAIHGAIGFTEEYDLQLFTRRLHAWRQTAGSEAYWYGVAGEALLHHQGMTLDIVRRITDVDTVL